MFEEGDTLLAVIQKSFFYNKIKVASNSNKGAKKWTKKNRHRSPALQTLKEYAVITAAVLIMDIGIYVFKFPQ